MKILYFFFVLVGIYLRHAIAVVLLPWLLFSTWRYARANSGSFAAAWYGSIREPILRDLARPFLTFKERDWLSWYLTEGWIEEGDDFPLVCDACCERRRQRQLQELRRRQAGRYRHGGIPAPSD